MPYHINIVLSDKQHKIQISIKIIYQINFTDILAVKCYFG